MDDTRQILTKTIKNLKSRESRILKELFDIEESIIKVENTISELFPFGRKIIINKSSKTIPRKKRSNTITEESIREAVIYFFYNSPDNSKERFPIKKGFFTAKHVHNYLSVATNEKIYKILKQFAVKGILETSPYKGGNQYRYIPPADQGPGEAFKNQQNQQKNSDTVPYSDPIANISNHNIKCRDKDVEKYINDAKKQGFVVSYNGSDHIVVSSPDMKKNVIVSKTSYSGNLTKKIKSELQKLGVTL